MLLHPVLTGAASQILDALRGAPDLAAIATPALASQLAGLVTEARPVALVLQAMGDLQRKAAAAAAVGAAMGARELAGKAVTFTLGARQRVSEARSWGAARAKVDRSPTEAPPDQAIVAAGWKAMAIAAANPRAASRPTW